MRAESNCGFMDRAGRRLDEEEVAAARRHNFTIVLLGKLSLRAETAAIAAACVVCNGHV